MLILVLDSKLWLAGHMLSKWALHMRIQFHFYFIIIFGLRLRRESERIAL
jgi:hypothetical protein